VKVLDGKPQYVELAGNLAPVSKSGDQPSVLFRAFRENRLPFIVRVRDATHDASGRLAFVPESRAARPTASDMVITPTCTLNITLPNYVPGVGVHLDEEEMAEMHKAYTRAGGRPGSLTLLKLLRLNRNNIYQRSTLAFRLLVVSCLLLYVFRACCHVEAHTIP